MCSKQLRQAALRGDTDTVRALLADGVPPDEPSAKGMTALMAAAYQGDHVECVRTLLDAGAQPTVRQASSAWTAVTFAAVNGSEQCLALFLEQGVEFDLEAGDWKMLHFATQYRSRDNVARLLAAGFPPDARDDEGRTALHRAARNSDAKLVAVLLEAGADASATDESGRTPLHEACSRANVPNVRRLLAAGASADMPDAAGQTPRDVAVGAGRAKIIAALDEPATAE